MFCNKEYQEYDWSWQLEGLSDNTRIQKISFKCMDDKEHSDNSDDDTPARVLDYSSEENRDSTDKDSENRDKTREKGDTSKREDIGEYKAPIETQLSIKKADNKETEKGEDGICNRYFSLSTKYETKAFLYLFE